MVNHTESPVLIVGAGAAGLTAAATLAAAGISPLVVERRPEPSSLPRATSITTRSMEIFRGFGLEPAIRAGGNDVDWVLWRCETLARAAEGSGFAIGLPTAEQAALVSPTSPACVPQDHLEHVLGAHLRERGVEVARGTEVVAVEVVAGGVEATLRDAHGERRVRARYLVGADGAHSRVRKGLAIAMHGSEHVADAVAVVFRAPLWDVVGDQRFGIYGVAAVDAAYLPAGPGNRWGFGRLYEPGQRPEQPEAEIVEEIRRGAGVPDLPVRIERLGTFATGVQLAERYRSGNAFLVGDAAHRVTPRGGRG